MKYLVMKNKIFLQLDKMFTINGNVVEMNDDLSLSVIVRDIFGVTDITIYDWFIDRMGERYEIHYDDGDIVRHTNGKQHSIDDIPAYETPGGGREWFKHGKLHREGSLNKIEGRHAVEYEHTDEVEYWDNGNLIK